MEHNNSIVLKILAILLPIDFFIINSIKINSKFMEFYTYNYYAFSKLKIWFFSFFKYSIGDIFYLLSFFLLIYFLLKRRVYYKYFISSIFIEITACLSLIYLFFQLNWGLNYFQEPITLKLGVDKSYSITKLENTLDHLINQSNSLHKSLSLNDSVPLIFPFNKKEIKNKLNAETNLLVKNSILSKPISYMGYSGYLNPFTLEAHVNENIPIISYITTIIHEQTHQKGIAAENEANFLTYKQATENQNQYIQFAGYTFALRYCMFELHKRNNEKFLKFSNKISPGVKKNLKVIDEFWREHKNPFYSIFDFIYDKFLKINSQKSGTLSYNEMVALVIFDYEKEFLEL